MYTFVGNCAKYMVNNQPELLKQFNNDDNYKRYDNNMHPAHAELIPKLNILSLPN